MSELKQSPSKQIYRKSTIVIENKVAQQSTLIEKKQIEQQKQQQKAIVSEQINHELIKQEPNNEGIRIKQAQQNIYVHKNQQETIQIFQNKEAADAIEKLQQPPPTENHTEINNFPLHIEQKHEINEEKKEKKEQVNAPEQKGDLNFKYCEQNIQKIERQKDFSNIVQKEHVNLIEQNVNQTSIRVHQTDKDTSHMNSQIVDVKIDNQQEISAQKAYIIQDKNQFHQQVGLFSKKPNHTDQIVPQTNQQEQKSQMKPQKQHQSNQFYQIEKLSEKNEGHLNQQNHQQGKKQVVVTYQQKKNHEQPSIHITQQQQINQGQQEKDLIKVNQQAKQQETLKQLEKQCVIQHDPLVHAIEQHHNQNIELQDKKQPDLVIIQTPKQQKINIQKGEQLQDFKQNVQNKLDQNNNIENQNNNSVNRDSKKQLENAQAMPKQQNHHLKEEQINIQHNQIKQEQTRDFIKIEETNNKQLLVGLQLQSENKLILNEFPQVKAQNIINQSQQKILHNVNSQQKDIVQTNNVIEKIEKQQSSNFELEKQKQEQQQKHLIKLIITTQEDKIYIVPNHVIEQSINQNTINGVNKNLLENISHQVRAVLAYEQNELDNIAPQTINIEQPAIVCEQRQEKYQVEQLKQQVASQLKIQNIPNQFFQVKERQKDDHQTTQLININYNVAPEHHEKEKIEQKHAYSHQNNQIQNRQPIKTNILNIESDKECSNKEEPVLSQDNIQFISDHKAQKQQKSNKFQACMETQNIQRKQIQQSLMNKEQIVVTEVKNEVTQKVQKSAEQGIKQQNQEKCQSEFNQQPKNNQNNINNHTVAQNSKYKPDQVIENSKQEQKLYEQKPHTQNIEKKGERQHLNKQFVEFIEFNQQYKIKMQNLEINNENQPKSQVSLELQTQQKKDTQTIVIQTLSQDTIQKQPRPKTVEVLQQQMYEKKAPIAKQNTPNKEGVGRITRKIISEKRVHDVIQDLKKYEQKEPKKQPRPSSRRRKLDIAKSEHISLKSNIVSITIGQILSKDDHMESNQLLTEIDQLKKKLFQLQKRKEISWQNQEQNSQRPQRQTIMTNKSNKKLNTGKIYKKSESNNSRVIDEVQTFGYETEKNNLVTISSAPRQRFSSTKDFFVAKGATKETQFQNKTGPILFRVKKNNKNVHGPFDFNLTEKEAIAKNKEFDSEDKCFQTRRQYTEKLQFTQQEKLNTLQKHKPRLLHFQENFRQQLEKYFIDLGNLLPKKEWSQEQLVQIARQTFQRFGVNIQSQKNLTLSVKKYKNCVSFVLDSNRTILWYYEGKFYFGGWKTNRQGEGEKNGCGYDYSPGKYVFSGYYIQNKRDGYGVIKLLTKQQDVIYQGGWKNGLKHGQGKQKEPDGSQYIGEWAQGKKNGKGKIKGSDQEYFEGSFLKGVKNGEGIQKFKNGDSYQGNYYDGKFHGIGVYTWANQSKYQGQFKEGSRNGNGTWVSNYNEENSDRYEGQYRNDHKNGFGIYRWKDGTVYEGQFLNDLKHGQGIVSYGDGKSTKLQWFEGNLVSKQNVEKQRIGGKRSKSKSSSKKTEQKKNQIKTPFIKFNIGNESKLKPTRMSFGIQQI